MLKLVVVTVFVLSAIAEVSAQTETCILKAENAECARNSECCTRCCAEGRCSLDAKCFTACDPSMLATSEGPDLCRLTKAVDELLELVKTDLNKDLSDGIPVLANVIRLSRLFVENPLSAFTRINDFMKDVETIRGLLDISEAGFKQILSDVVIITDTVTHLLSTITADTQG